MRLLIRAERCQYTSFSLRAGDEDDDLIGAGAGALRTCHLGTVDPSNAVLVDQLAEYKTHNLGGVAQIAIDVNATVGQVPHLGTAPIEMKKA